MSIWIWVCATYGHLASRHRLPKGAELYRCGHCDCEISQESPMHEHNREDVALLAANPPESECWWKQTAS